MTITGGTALGKDEIDRMVKDAEAHAEEDRVRREEAEVRNNADTLVFQTEKLLKDQGDKVQPDEKEKIEAALKALKDALGGHRHRGDQARPREPGQRQPGVRPAALRAGRSRRRTRPTRVPVRPAAPGRPPPTTTRSSTPRSSTSPVSRAREHRERASRGECPPSSERTMDDGVDDRLNEFEDELTPQELEVAEAQAAVEDDLAQLSRRARRAPRHAAPGPGRLRELPQAGRCASRPRSSSARPSGSSRSCCPVLDAFDAARSRSLGRRPTSEVRKGVELVLARAARRCSSKAGLERIDADGDAVRPDRARGRPARAERRRRRAATSPRCMRTGYRLEGPGPAPGHGEGDEAERADGATAGVVREGLLRRARRVVRRRPTRRSRAPTGSWRKQYHPDANPGDTSAEERFKEISAAYDVLGDAEKRKEYDEVREMVASGVGPGGPGGFGGAGPGGFGGFGGNVRVDDLGDLGDLGGLFGNLFGGRGGRRGRNAGPVGPQRGADLETELHLAFLDAVHGVTTSVNVTSEAPCSLCHGTGATPGTVPERCARRAAARARSTTTRACSRSPQVCPHVRRPRHASSRTPCPHCQGRGIERRGPRTVKVRIPAGVDDGQRIRVKGRGAPGLNGGPPGDLYVVVHVAPAPGLRPRAASGTSPCSVPITFPEAALGAQVKVPTLDAPGHAEGPGRARSRARPSAVQGPRHRRGRRATPATCSSRRRRRARTKLDDEQRGRGRGARRGRCTDDPRASYLGV